MTISSSSPSPKARPLTWACAAMGGSFLVDPAELGASFSGAATDSRQVMTGRLFFALPGERADGFDFCSGAARHGAAALVVSRERGQPTDCGGVPVIAVTDVRRALGDLARAVRSQFKGRVIGVTGSNGKTTTKELIAAALSVGGTVLRTQGNLNTDVGLPLTVLDATEDETFWVLEMAMRARGEIAYLADIAKPHVGVVTNVAGAHLERLGSIDEVARAKGEIFHGLAEGGIAVLPADDERLEHEARGIADARKLRFGFLNADPSRCHVRVLDFTPAGEDGSVIRLSVAHTPVTLRLPLPGEHNARNAAAALAVASACEVPIDAASARLESATLPAHRSRLLSMGGRIVMDDCYNANPTSMHAALQTVAASVGSSARAFAILGDMLEVGSDTANQHEALGQEVVALKFAGLAAVGELAAHMASGARGAGLSRQQVVATHDPELAAAVVADWSRPGDWILIKASRGTRLERALEALQKKLGN